MTLPYWSLQVDGIGLMLNWLQQTLESKDSTELMQILSARGQAMQSEA
jgi:hypothetical protein